MNPGKFYAPFLIAGILLGHLLHAQSPREPEGEEGENRLECSWDWRNPCADGNRCQFDGHCASGFCARWAGGGGEKICVPWQAQLPNGEPCSNNPECQYDYCDPATHRCAETECQDSDGAFNWHVAGDVRNVRNLPGSIPFRFGEDGIPQYTYLSLNRDGSIAVYPDRCASQRIFDGVTIENGEEVPIYRFVDGVEDGVCTADGSWMSIFRACPRGTRCDRERAQCIPIDSLAGEGRLCSSDDECEIDLLCEDQEGRPRCVKVDQPGELVPDTLGQQCQIDADCEGNLKPPMAVCEWGQCRGGVLTPCRYGCSLEYACDDRRGVCYTDREPGVGGTIPRVNGAACSNNEGCQSQICIGESSYLGIGICRDDFLGDGESCLADEDCVSLKCVGARPEGFLSGRCEISPPYGACTADRGCERGLDCVGHICQPPRQQIFQLPRGCENIKELIAGHNRLDENRINFVFVAVDWPADISLREKAILLLNFASHESLGNLAPFALEPLSSNKGRFNLWYLDQNLHLESQPDESRDDLIRRLGRLWDNCSLINKYVIRIYKAEFTEGAEFGANVALSLRELTNQPISSEAAVLTHELGHAVAELMDEYVSEELGDYPNFPNCAPDEDAAESWWGDLVGQGQGKTAVRYFDGCSYVNDNTRPNESTMMYHQLSGDDFGPVNYRHYCYKILEATGAVDDACREAIRRAPRQYYRDIAGFKDESLGDKLLVALAPQRPGTQIPIGVPNPEEVKGDTSVSDGMEFSEPLLTFEIHNRQGKVEIQNIETKNWIYHPFFEDSGIFDTRLNITLGNRTVTKGVHWTTLNIEEKFREGWLVDDKVEKNKSTNSKKLRWGVYLSPVSVEEENKKIIKVKIPLDDFKFKPDSKFSVRIENKKKKIDLNFTCENRRCIAKTPVSIRKRVIEFFKGFFRFQVLKK